MENKTVVKSSGIGFVGALTLLFIALKLMNYIAWSWWWVLSPLWLPSAVVIGIGLAIGTIALFVNMFTTKNRYK